MNHNQLIVECDVHFDLRSKGEKQLRVGPEPALPIEAPGRLPRVSRWMALAIHFEELIRTGEVANYTELSRIGGVTRARITQIMNLLLLAPDIQEEILFLPRVQRGCEPLLLRDLQPIAAESNWERQRVLFRPLNPSSESD